MLEATRSLGLRDSLAGDRLPKRIEPACQSVYFKIYFHVYDVSSAFAPSRGDLAIRACCGTTRG